MVSLSKFSQKWHLFIKRYRIEFTNIWETAFGVTGTFDCNVDRPKGKDTTNQMFLINHFLDTALGDLGTVPNVASLKDTNAATGPNSVGSQVTSCQTLYGRNPNFILVDVRAQFFFHPARN